MNRDAQYPVARQEGGIELCRSPVCLELIDYWKALADRSGGKPTWQGVNLMDLYRIAHCLAVKDVLDGGADYINRFWGSSLTDALGFEATYKKVSAYDPVTMRQAVLRRYGRVAETGVPEMVRGYMASMPEHEHIPFELVHLPLWDEKAGGVQHIISAYHFGFSAPDAGD